MNPHDRALAHNKIKLSKRRPSIMKQIFKSTSTVSADENLKNRGPGGSSGNNSTNPSSSNRKNKPLLCRVRSKLLRFHKHGSKDIDDRYSIISHIMFHREPFLGKQPAGFTTAAKAATHINYQSPITGLIDNVRNNSLKCSSSNISSRLLSPESRERRFSEKLVTDQIINLLCSPLIIPFVGSEGQEQGQSQGQHTQVQVKNTPKMPNDQVSKNKTSNKQESFGLGFCGK